MISELEAVNRMLRVIGQVPVAFIPESGQSDSRIALEVLKEYAVELQQDGYDFNTLSEVSLEPGAGGFIAIPANVLRVIPYNPQNRYTVRSGRLFDLDKRTDVFTAPAVVTLITKVDFESLPYPLQNYVVIRASRVFSNRVVGAPEQNGYNSEDEARARITWLNTVAEDMQLNLLSNDTHHRPHTFRPYQAIARGLS